jgi:hypothetical protein
LTAVAEVLAKMDDRLTKEEEEEGLEEEEKAVQAEKSDLVKAVASEVVSMLKDENPLGLDVDGSKERKAKASAPQFDDAQTAANPTTKIEDQQQAIQAADVGDDEDDEDTKKTYKARDDDEDNGSDEEPVEKGDDEDEDKKYNFDKANDDEDEEDDDGMKAMRKELDALRKTVAAYEANMEKSVEARLRKMGFREENGLQRPQLKALGTDGTTPIVKSKSTGDVADDLASLSYKQLRDLQHKIDSGDTSGVPRELLN